MKVVAIIQARMGSSRLPGKVLMDIAGDTMLSHVVRRVQAVDGIEKVVVATSTSPENEAIQAESQRLAVPCFRGNEGDVLDRYYRAALEYEAEAIVRITADCPLLDPGVTGNVVAAFLAMKPDYASNTLERTYPRGLDCEVFSFSALAKAWNQARRDYEREHVTPYFYENPHYFKLLSITSDYEDLGDYRWTVDTPEDLSFVRALYEELRSAPNFSFKQVLRTLEKKPELIDVNAHVQ